MDDIPQEPVAGQMCPTAPARTPLSPAAKPRELPPPAADAPAADAGPAAAISSPVGPKASPRPWKPPGAADMSDRRMTRSASAGAIPAATGRPHIERSASCAGDGKLQRAPALRHLPLPEAGARRPEARRTPRPKAHEETALAPSPQSATATTASAEPSSYGLVTPLTWTGQRKDARARPEPASPATDVVFWPGPQPRGWNCLES
eukprot:Skav230306  [mRNA]  locus=scaffold430:75205:76566:+ [translate_table: standard]